MIPELTDIMAEILFEEKKKLLRRIEMYVEQINSIVDSMEKPVFLHTLFLSKSIEFVDLIFRNGVLNFKYKENDKLKSLKFTHKHLNSDALKFLRKLRMSVKKKLKQLRGA